MEFDLSKFDATNRIEVTTNLNRPLATITEAERIQTALQALHRFSAGWEVPEEGVPVADTRLNFYAGERPLGNLGLGSNFLTLHHKGTFFSQRVAPEVTAEMRAQFIKIDLSGVIKRRK